MHITTLIENTEGSSGCMTAHGLSFYIETAKHRILMDAGPSGRFLKNAEQLGIDLAAVDLAVLSHGHYDHSGGMLPFTELNPRAAIYVQDSFDGDYYGADLMEDGSLKYRYIGVAPELAAHPQIKRIHGDVTIDEELRLFTVDQRNYPLPSSNRTILVKDGDSYVQDPFRHEQCLVITENGRNVLFSGCAHNGILSILDEYKRKFGNEPDAVISGFHLMKMDGSDFSEQELQEISEIAETLEARNTVFYTCHCTGVPAYERMKEIMGEKLRYVHSGDSIEMDWVNK